MGIVRSLTPTFIRKRYVAKFVITVVVVILLIAAVGSANYVQTREQGRENTADQMTSTARLQAAAISDWTERMESQTVTVAANTPTSDSDEINSYLNDQQARLTSDVQRMYYVDTDTGEITASTVEQARGQNVDTISAPWASRSLVDGQPTDSVWRSRTAYRCSETRVCDVLGDQVMAFATPVEGDENGMLVLVGKLEARVGSLYQPYDQQSTTIVTDDGTTVLQSGTGTDPAIDESALAAAQGDSVEFTVVNGNAQAYAPVEGTDWVAVTTVPASNAFQVQDAIGLNLLLVVITSLVGLIGMVGVLGRHTVTPLSDLQQRVRQMEQGDLEVEFDVDREDEFGQLYDGFASMQRSLKERITVAEEARQEAELAREETETINRQLERDARSYRETMQLVADGDLSQRMEPSSDNEAMEGIAAEFNATIAEIEGTVADLKAFSEEVAASSEEVTASAEEVRSASQAVTESIQQISEGADQQEQTFQMVADEMNQLSTTIQEITSLSNQVADLSEQTAETGKQGRKAAQEAIAGMNQIEEKSQSAVDQIETLDEDMEMINELVDLISDLSNRTNQLALNANIEASRASSGEGSSGFGVVAEEIVDRVHTQADRAVERVTETGELIEGNTESIRNSVQALERVAEFANETNTGVQEISAATEQQAASTQQVVAMVDQAAAIAEDTSEEAENVAASAEEQTTAMSEVSDSISELSRQANELSEALQRFQTDATGETTITAESGADGSEDPESVFDHSPPDGEDEGDASGADRTEDDPSEHDRPDAMFESGGDEQ